MSRALYLLIVPFERYLMVKTHLHLRAFLPCGNVLTVHIALSSNASISSTTAPRQRSAVMAARKA